MASNERRYLSGAQKRKKKEMQISEVKKLKPINSYFSSSASERIESESVTSEPLPSKPDTTGSITDTDEVNLESSLSTKINNEFSSNKNPIMSNSLSCSNDKNVANPSDKGLFPGPVLSTKEKKLIISLGSCRPKGPFPVDEKTKSHFSEYYYDTINKAGIKISRTWLCYSKILDCAYCEPCWLFADRSSPNFKSTWVDGIQAWRKLSEKISVHEKSRNHHNACITYELWRSNDTIDKDIEVEIQKEKFFWRKVLDRLLNITITLAMCDLPFRGHREYIGNPGKSGNFLSVVELLATYDPVLKELIEKPSKSIKYLSPQIQNELIDLLSNAVSGKITKDIKAAPFFSIIMDTTQDIAKVDQLSQVFRYVTIEKDDNDVPTEVKVHESFLGFKEVRDATAEGLKNDIISSINDKGIDLSKCRGQGYDGAAVMSGSYSGVQKRILEESNRAVYVHCASHNLNLVLNDAVNSITEVSKFFDTLEHIYVFFANSMKRWSILSDTYLPTKEKCLKLKRLCPTRWSSRNESLLAIKFNYSKILQALSKIILSSKAQSERDDAISIKKNMETFEFVFQVILHTKILTSIDVVSKLLQRSNTDLCEAKTLLEGALNNLRLFRLNFDGAKDEALKIAQTWNVKAQFSNKRIRKAKIYFDELCQDERLTNGESRFRVNVFYCCLDIVINQLQKRFVSLNDIVDSFNIIQPQQLIKVTDNELHLIANQLVEKYQGDITDQLPYQLLSLRTCLNIELAKLRSVKELADLLFIQHFRLSASFPDVCTIILLFLTIPVTVATSERSFSKLKIIKTYLRNSMRQERLSNLSILSIEHEQTNRLRNNLEEIVEKFAEMKVRRVKL